MSMLDAFLNKGFKGSKCKTLLKLTIPRIKLLRNRRESQLKQMRRDIAKLLEAGQEATARIRVEHIIREENMMAAQEIIELYCELISVRLPIIESQRECPLDLKTAISSICFAAPRCADLPELLQVQLAFASKYGKEFVAAASELMPDCGVDRQIVELLSVRAPSPEKKMKLLKEIAEEHEVDWDPAPSEAELFKSHEDLLNGPTQFVSGSKLPLPKENDEILQSSSVHVADEHSESEEEFDELDFPEVPNVSVRPSAGAEIAAPQPSAPHPEPYAASTTPSAPHPEPYAASTTPSAPHPEPYAASTTPSAVHPEPYVPFGVPFESDERSVNQSITDPESTLQDVKHESPKSSVNVGMSKQFVPFISRPLLSETSAAARESSQPPKPLTTKSDMIHADLDFTDVLAAAKAAADSAERAASAARAAASLAEIRISELTKNRSGQSPDRDVENPFHASSSNLPAEMENLRVDDYPSGDKDVSYPWSAAESFEYNQTANGTKHTTDGVTDLESFPPGDKSFKDEFPYHQPQRIPSMDDESVFSYPNLFSSQGGNMPSDYPTSDNSPPRQGSDLK